MFWFYKKKRKKLFQLKNMCLCVSLFKKHLLSTYVMQGPGTPPKGPVHGGLLVCYCHHRFAYKQRRHHQRSSLLMKTFWCSQPMFSNFLRSLVRSAKAPAEPFTVHFLEGSSFSSPAVSFSLASSSAVGFYSRSTNSSLVNSSEPPLGAPQGHPRPHPD